MQLDIDCVRDLLLSIENFQTLESATNEDALEWKYLYMKNLLQIPRLKKYSEAQIAYTAICLAEGDFIKESHLSAGDYLTNISISTLTFKGHEYLEQIRDDERFKKIKGIGNSVRDYSLTAINEIAKGVTSAAIEKCLRP